MAQYPRPWPPTPTSTPVQNWSGRTDRQTSQEPSRARRTTSSPSDAYPSAQPPEAPSGGQALTSSLAWRRARQESHCASSDRAILSAASFPSSPRSSSALAAELRNVRHSLDQATTPELDPVFEIRQPGSTRSVRHERTGRPTLVERSVA